MSYVALAGLAIDLGTQLIDRKTEKGFDDLNPSATAGAPIEVAFTAAGQQKIPHKLGRQATGFNIVCRMANEQVWDYQAPDDKFVYLQASAAVTIKIVVY